MSDLTSTPPTQVPCLLGSQPFTSETTDRTFELNLIDYLKSHPSISAVLQGRIYPLSVKRDGTTWPALVYSVASVEHVTTLEGSVGFAIATVEFDVWSNLHSDLPAVSLALRKALHGFSGWMNNVWVMSSLPEVGSESDSKEDPKDSSGTFWFQRSIDYVITYSEQTTRF